MCTVEDTSTIRGSWKGSREEPFRQPGEAKMVQIPISLKFGSNEARARLNSTEHILIKMKSRKVQERRWNK